MEQKQIKLAVNNLKISFRTDGGNVQAVRDISFELYKGETLAIVGESGSGKSVTNRAIMGILAGNAIKEGGEIIYDGQDLMKIGEDAFHKIRGDKIAMIFQDPMSSLNPIMRVGKQLTEAMLIKGRLNQRQSRKDFNGTLAALKESMDVSLDNPADRNEIARHEKLCKDFDRFEYKHLALENSYNRAKEGAEDALESLDDVLFRIEKKSFGHLRGDIAEIVRNAVQSCERYVVYERADELKALLKEISKETRVPLWTKFCNAVRFLAGKRDKKETYDFAATGCKLERVREILTEALQKPKPNFFAMGYYLSFAGSPLPDAEVTELNVFLRKYLDENFMLGFIETARRGVEYSHLAARENRCAAITLINALLPTLRNERSQKKDFYRAAKIMVEAVEIAIDALEVEKDNLSFTFESSLYSAIDGYFDAERRNEEENRRYARQTKRYERALARGKTPDYEVADKDLVDLQAAREEIANVALRLRQSFEDADASDRFDATEKTVAIIDYLKEKASGVAYKVTRGMAKTRALKLLKEVGIPDPVRRYRQYPFEFSGGMRQRIVIAIALSANPDILICDEPTTALDVTIQSQILELINKVKRERSLSVIFITHDLGVVANMADRVAVMYAGKIVEIGTANDVFYSPAHPYTWALLSSMPDLDTKEELEAIPGTPPNMIYPPKGDAFAERNKYAMQIDFEEQPPMFRISDTHFAATWLLHPDAPKVDPPKSVTDRIERMKNARRQSDENAGTVAES